VLVALCEKGDIAGEQVEPQLGLAGAARWGERSARTNCRCCIIVKAADRQGMNEWYDGPERPVSVKRHHVSGRRERGEASVAASSRSLARACRHVFSRTPPGSNHPCRSGGGDAGFDEAMDGSALHARTAKQSAEGGSAIAEAAAAARRGDR